MERSVSQRIELHIVLTIMSAGLPQSCPWNHTTSHSHVHGTNTVMSTGLHYIQKSCPWIYHSHDHRTTVMTTGPHYTPQSCQWDYTTHHSHVHGTIVMSMGLHYTPQSSPWDHSHVHGTTLHPKVMSMGLPQSCPRDHTTSHSHVQDIMRILSYTIPTLFSPL